jgi:hypothetical protein
MKNVRGKRSRSKKRRVTPIPDDEILPEYDFSRARPNKYARRFGGGRNIVVLEPDVARRFPDSAAVNEALRALLEIADKARAPGMRRRRTA